MLNLNKHITNLRGEESKLSYPSQAILDALPRRADGSPDESQLPPDTYRNVIINALSLYPVKDKREVLWVNALASDILSSGDEIELKEQYKKFLIDVLYEQTAQVREDGKRTGIYMAWVVAPILKDLGVE